MGIYKTFLSILLIVLFSLPLGMSALILDGKPLLETPSADKFPVPAEIIKQTQKKLQESLQKFHFNGTALIAFHGEIILEEAKGFANFKTKTPINIESGFQLASASKPFTALSIMILKERKLLDYDDKAIKYLPTFPYPDITIRQLLNHTSGLQNYMYLVDNYWSNNKSISNEDMLDLIISHHLPLNNIPGRRFEYSNTGYAILALIVEKITHEYFGDFLNTEIFSKIGMTNSFVYNRNQMEQDSGQVVGYTSPGRWAHQYYHDANNEIMGDKSVFSTVHDLYKFTQALNNYELVDKSTLDEAYTKAILTNSRSVNYGFGWRLREDEHHNYIYHNGAWHGFASTITLEPDSKITLVLLNNTSASIASIKRDLLSIMHTQLDPYIQ